MKGVNYFGSGRSGQDGVSASSTTSALESIVYKEFYKCLKTSAKRLTNLLFHNALSFSVLQQNKRCTRYCTHILHFNP